MLPVLPRLIRIWQILIAIDNLPLLSRKGLKLDLIAAELSGTYGQDAHKRASIKWWLHQLKLRRTDLKILHVGEATLA
jgi:hypothetical protein